MEKFLCTKHEVDVWIYKDTCSEKWISKVGFVWMNGLMSVIRWASGCFLCDVAAGF